MVWKIIRGFNASVSETLALFDICIRYFLSLLMYTWKCKHIKYKRILFKHFVVQTGACVMWVAAELPQLHSRSPSVEKADEADALQRFLMSSKTWR